MKVAVLYSGQIRGESYKDNIWYMKTMLPDADFFFTTWKGDDEYQWIDHYFDEPHVNYNCERYIHEHSIEQLRKAKEKYGYVPEDDEEFKTAKHRRVLRYDFRKQGRDRTKQHLAHALAFEKYCEGKDYDVVIRIRYDLRFENFKKTDIEHMIDLCYSENKPVTIGYMGDYPEGQINEVKAFSDGKGAIGDVVVCHKADMFDPKHVYNLSNQKELASAEGGWWQIIVTPYTDSAYCANCMWAWIDRNRWR